MRRSQIELVRSKFHYKPLIMITAITDTTVRTTNILLASAQNLVFELFEQRHIETKSQKYKSAPAIKATVISIFASCVSTIIGANTSQASG